MSATTNLGKVSVTPKGAWAITNAYEILDIVTSGGSSYLAKQDVPTGVSLSNTSYWIMIAEKGDGGEVTSASASISGGYGTPGVSVTAGGTAHERTLAFAFTNLRGEKGETGNGIDSVYKTGTSGLVDTYTILFTDGSTYEFEVNNGTASIDDTLTKSGWAADAKVVGDTKASIDGFYETMGVGVADNLTPYSEDSGATQDIPFIAQGTGCGNGESVVDTGSYLQFKKKLGNTVCVNQPCKNPYFANGTTNWSVFHGSPSTIAASGGILTQTIPGGTSTNAYRYGVQQDSLELIAEHKHITIFVVEPSTPTTFRVEVGGAYAVDTGVISSKTCCAVISKAASYNQNVLIYPKSAVDNVVAPAMTIKYYFIGTPDITRWFGSDDAIPSGLLSHPEDWGKYFAGSLAYNAGTLDSADGSILTSLPRSLFDVSTSVSGEWINPSTGAFASATNSWRSDYIPTIPNTEYFLHGIAATMNSFVAFYDVNKQFISRTSASASGDRTVTTPSNCFYIAFCNYVAGAQTYTDARANVTFSLYYPGEPGYSEYYPFSVLAEVDTGSEVLRSAGAVADEKTPDGTITRRVGTIDLGTLTWNYDSGNDYMNVSTALPNAVRVQAGSVNVIAGCEYTLVNAEALGGATTKAYTLYDGRPFFKNTGYTDPAAFKTAMSGVYLYYELATPTTEQGTPFAENIPCDDFGSLMWTNTKGIPQGNEIFYPVDYKASIDTLYNRVEGDMGAIVIDSQLDVVADRIPEAPSEDGTYTLKATVSSGTKTYSWVADE